MVRAMYKVAVFARHPAVGQVKTRLSPALPERLATDVYVAMLLDTLAAVSELDAFERHIYWAGEGSIPSLVPPGFTMHDQRGNDLGERLERAFEDLLSSPGDRVVIVGSDCPGLSAALVRSAFAELTTHDVVLGPASDGGYWLVGLRKRAPALFRGMPWSTSGVLAHTLDRATRSELSVARLRMLDDLDTPADLARVVARALHEDEACGVRLRTALRNMALLPE